MKGRFFSLLLLTAIVLTSIVSAATFTATLDGDLTKKDNTVVLTITDTSGAANSVTVSAIPDIEDGSGHSLSVSGSGVVAVPASSSATVNLTYAGDTDDFALGTFSTDVVLTSGANNSTLTLNFISELCEFGCQGTYNDGTDVYKLELKIKSIDVTGLGPEDNEWYPLDDIEVKVNVDNKGNSDADIDDVTIKFCLYDESNDECILDEDDVEISDDGFNLDGGEDIDISITFQIDPNDFDNAGDYVMYVEAYSDDFGEENLAVQNSETVKIIDDDFAILANLKIPETVGCGENVEITGDVWNIGDDKNGEEISVNVQNKELGIDETVEIGDVNSWDSESVSFALTIPENAVEKAYSLKFSVYDEDSDLYETDEDKDESVFTDSLVVQGNCVKPVVKDASITASLESEEVKAGEEVVIKATVKNTGEEKTVYSIGVDGYEFFSTVESVTPATLTLDAGESGQVSITLKLNEDASGEQIFNIRALFDAEEVKQQVSLVVEGKTSITGGAIGSSLRENWFIWVIVLINIILIIAIITVAARMSKA